MLNELHLRRVNIVLALPDRVRDLRGIGNYEQDAHLGQVLRVDITDPEGDFSLLFSETFPTFAVEPSQHDDYDFRIDVPARMPVAECCGHD